MNISTGIAVALWVVLAGRATAAPTPFQIADSLARAGHVDAAVEHLARAAEHALSSGGPPDSTTVDLYRWQGILLYNAERYAEAEPLFLLALERQGALPASRSDQMGSLHQDLCALYMVMNRFNDAAVHCSASLDLMRDAGLPPDTLSFYALSNHAWYLRKTGQASLGLIILRETIDLLDDILPVADTNVAWAITDDAHQFVEAGDYATAAYLYTKADTILQRTLGPTSAKRCNHIGLAAQALISLGEPARAESLLVPLVQACVPEVPNDTLMYSNVLSALGDAFHKLNRFDEALSLHQKSAAMLRRAVERGADGYAQLKTALSAASQDLRSLGRPLEATRALEEAVQLGEEWATSPLSLSLLAYDIRDLGELMSESISPEAALPYFYRALEVRGRAGEAGSEWYFYDLEQLGHALLAVDAVAIDTLFSLIRAQRPQSGYDSSVLANVCDRIGIALHRTGEYNRAEQMSLFGMAVRPRADSSRESRIYPVSLLAGHVGAQGRIAEADSLIHVALARAGSPSPDYPAQGVVWTDAASVSERNRRWTEASDRYREAADAYTKAGSDYYTHAVTSIMQRAAMWQNQNHFLLAESILIAGANRFGKDSLNDSQAGIRLLTAATDLFSQREGEFAASSNVELLEAATRLALKQSSIDSLRVASLLRSVAHGYMASARLGAADSTIAYCFDFLTPLMDSRAGDTLVAAELVRCYSLLADVYAAMSELKGTLAAYIKGIGIADSLLAPGSYVALDISVQYAAFLAGKGAHDEANEVIEAYLQKLLSVYGPEHDATWYLLLSKASYLRQEGRNVEARSLIREVLDSKRRARKLSNRELADYLHRIAVIDMEMMHYAEAEPILLWLFNFHRENNSLSVPMQRNLQAELMVLYENSWKLDAAESLFTEILRVSRQRYPEHPQEAHLPLLDLSRTYLLQGRFDLAGKMIDGFPQPDSSSPSAPRFRSRINSLRGQIAFQQGDYATAQRWFSEIPFERDHDRTDEISLDHLATLPLLAWCQYEQLEDSAAWASLDLADRLLTRLSDSLRIESFLVELARADLTLALGSPAAAEGLYWKCLHRLERHGHPYVEASARARLGLGHAAMYRERYAAADSQFTDALSLLHRRVGKRHPLYARTLLALAKLNNQRGRFGLAQAQADQCIPLLRQAHGEAHPLLAEAHDVLAVSLLEQARYAEAEAEIQTCRRIHATFGGHPQYEEVDGVRTLKWAPYGYLLYLRRTAQMLLEQSRPWDAADSLATCVPSLEQVLTVSHPEVQAVWFEAASLQLELGQFGWIDTFLTTSRNYFVDSSALVERPSLLANLELLDGRLALARGDFVRAELKIRSALRIRGETLGLGDPRVAECHSHLGVLFARQNRLRESESVRRLAIAMYRDALGDLHPRVARATLQLAEWYRDLGQLVESESLFREAHDLFGQMYGAAHKDVATALGGLADAHRLQGHADEARLLYLRQQGVLREVFRGTDHVSMAQCITSIADCDVRTGQLTRADSTFNVAIRMFTDLVGETAPEQVSPLLGSARCAIRRGDWELALSRSNLAFQLARQAFLHNAIALSESDALAYSRSISDAASTYFTAFLGAGATDSFWTYTAADMVLQVKGQVSEEMFDRRRQSVQESDSALQTLSAEWHEISMRRSRLVASQGDAVLKKALLDSLNSRASELESQVALHSSQIRMRRERSEVTSTRVASLLPEGAVLIEFYAYDDQLEESVEERGRYLAMVQGRNGPPHIVGLGPAQSLENAIRKYRNHLDKVSSGGYTLQPLDPAVYEKLSAAVWRGAWSPLEPLLQGAQWVLVAPDAALNRVSFAALKDISGTYLIEHFPIHYLSSGRDLLRVDAQGPPDAAVGGLLAVGDPDYDANAVTRASGRQANRVTSKTSAAPSTRNVRSSCGALSDLQVARLPATRGEIQRIADAWKSTRQTPVSSFLGSQATEDNFKQHAAGRAVLHVATHGFFLSDACEEDTSGFWLVENPLLRSGLLFAGANLHGTGADSAGIEDGIMTAEEAANLSLEGTRLVVLSACETGLGESKAGEGVYGLRRAFLLAGAHTVMTSLWPVPDKETAAMMVRIYEQDGARLPELLRQAQRNRIAQNRAARLDHPFNWGAFVLLGSWE